jgi:hypothetical protein
LLPSGAGACNTQRDLCQQSQRQGASAQRCPAGPGQAAIASFRRSATEAVAARRFCAIITDGPGQPFANPPSLRRYFHQCPQALLAGVPAALFLPVAGARVRPKYVWLPRGGGSCAAAVSILNGTARESRP